MPCGTGNDLSNSLGFGCNLGINYLHTFFSKVNSLDTKQTNIDSWKFTMKNNKKIPDFSRVFFMYVGLGVDA